MKLGGKALIPPLRGTTIDSRQMGHLKHWSVCIKLALVRADVINGLFWPRLEPVLAFMAATAASAAATERDNELLWLLSADWPA